MVTGPHGAGKTVALATWAAAARSGPRPPQLLVADAMAVPHDDSS